MSGINCQIIVVKQFCAGIIIFFFFNSAYGQYVFKDGALPRQLSLIPYAKIADVGEKTLTITQVQQKQKNLNFSAMHGEFGNLGFTKRNYWVKFEVENQTSD
ncbi:MAG: hypothetical protein EOO20_12980, partial [Chryseobacterium sp.]